MAGPTPKKKAKKLKQGLEVGDSGTRMFSGIINEEYNPKLIDTRGIRIYDEMRKSDGTVRAAVLACTLPIRSANWFVKPASEEQADIDVADFVTGCLWEYSEQPFTDFLRQALLSLPFGVMVFEKVFGSDEIDGKTRIIWDKLAARVPHSIQKWATSDGQPGITQITSKGGYVSIPMEKLIVFVNEREGDNWWGTSILRSAYKHWYIKSTIEKIDAIAHERQGLGIPKIILPENATKSDIEKAEEIAKNIRSNSHAFIIQPDGYSIEFVDMKASTTRDPSNSLSYHSREIMKSVLAQFLELGSTSGGGTGGSRALSTNHSEIFLQSLEAVARSICATMNVQIRELVDLNFDVAEYPCLDFDGISEVDTSTLAATYKILSDAGAITPQEEDETYFRDMLEMPAFDEQGARERPQPAPMFPANDNTKKKAENSERRLPLKKNFSEGFKPFRKLTFTEQKVTFDALQSKMNELEDQFDTATKELLHAARDTYMAAFTKAAHAGDTQGIKEATLKVQAEYARIIKNALKAAFEYGKTNASKEIGADTPPNPADMLRQIDIQSDAIADSQITQITTDAKNAYVQSLNKGSSLTAALGAADAAAAAAIDTLTSDTTAIVVSGYINHGRNTVFDLNSDSIYALQRSELLDDHTCNYCESVDGRVVEKTDPFAQNTIFHSNCRGIWVAILEDEQDKPTIGGIPQGLRDRFGDAVNDLIQPKKPQRKRAA